MGFSKQFGRSGSKIAYLIARRNGEGAEFELEQKVELTNKGKSSKYIWSRTCVSRGDKEHVFVKNVKVLPDNSVEFIAEKIPIRVTLMNNYGRSKSLGSVPALKH
jgi:hypothetical protein